MPSDSQLDPQRRLSVLTAAIEATSDGILVVSVHGEVLHYNRRLLALWQLSPPLLHVDDSLHTAMLAALLRPLDFVHSAAALYAESEPEVPRRLELRDGRQLGISCQPLCPEGSYQGRIWSFRDLSRELDDALPPQQALEQKVAERTQEILGAQIFVDSVIDNIPDLIFVKDAAELRYVRLNRAVEQLFGTPAAGILGKTDFELRLAPELAERFLAEDLQVLKSGQVLEIPERVITAANGQSRTLQVTKIPILDVAGVPAYLLGICSDITAQSRRAEDERTLLAAQLAQTEAEKALLLRDEFLLIASHELKTPLSSLALQIDILHRLAKRGALNGQYHDKALELLTLSRQQIQRFGGLVDDLLDVSRISAGRLVLVRSAVDLAQVVQEVTQRLREEIVRSGSAVWLRLDRAPVGPWDPLRIEQVVVNLVSNAVKYGLGNPIEIEVRVLETVARLSIRDQGIGIAAADHARIFARFERAASSRRFGGLGLGLYITHEIVDLHGGTIEVTSELGKGSTFVVELPLVPPPLWKPGA